MPIPQSSAPGLLLMRTRFFVPRAWSALMRFSGIPHSPKPPIRMLAPSGTSATAASALARTLFIGQLFYFRLLVIPQRSPPPACLVEHLAKPLSFGEFVSELGQQ